MMLSFVSWPRSFNAAKRPGADMSRCFPPPAGTTRPLVAFMLFSSPDWLSEESSPLIEDGPRRNIELGSAEHPRSHEQRRVAEPEAAADQRLEQKRARAGNSR